MFNIQFLLLLFSFLCVCEFKKYFIFKATVFSPILYYFIDFINVIRNDLKKKKGFQQESLYNSRDYKPKNKQTKHTHKKTHEVY